MELTSATQLVCGGAESQALFLWGKQKVLVLCRLSASNPEDIKVNKFSIKR